MIIGEIKVRTKKELENLFEHLEADGFKWAGGQRLIGSQQFINFPEYIHIHDNKGITYYSESIPSDRWRYF